METSIRSDGSSVEATCDLQMSKTRWEAADFPELRRLWSAASLMDSDAVQFAP